MTRSPHLLLMGPSFRVERVYDHLPRRMCFVTSRTMTAGLHKPQGLQMYNESARGAKPVQLLRINLRLHEPAFCGLIWTDTRIISMGIIKRLRCVCPDILCAHVGLITPTPSYRACSLSMLNFFVVVAVVTICWSNPKRR